MMTRTDYAYQQIKNWLLNGNLKPGETISSYKLAEVLKLSRTPVISALKRLEQEGYIEVIPQVGCMVKLPTVKEAREKFMIRAVLEGFAAELAAYKRTDKDIEELKAIYEQSIIVAQGSNPVEYAKWNKEFHLKIAQMANMDALMDLLEGFWENISFHAASTDFLLERHAVSIKEHGQILSAIESGNSSKARRFMETHLRKCTNDFCDSIAKFSRELNLEESKTYKSSTDNLLSPEELSV